MQTTVTQIIRAAAAMITMTTSTANTDSTVLNVNLCRIILRVVRYNKMYHTNKYLCY